MSEYASEADYLRHYDPRRYSSPLVSVDLAIFSLLNGQLQVLLVQRADYPQKQRWALPGGFVNVAQDRDLLDTARRKLHEKTGVRTPYLEQVASVGGPSRDPRGWSITILYMALIAHVPARAVVNSVAEAAWWPVEEALALPLAFDHVALLQQARERLRSRTAYTLLPVHVLQAPFTLTQLQQAFEELLGAPLEKKAFRRRVLNAGVLEEVGEALPDSGRGRPALHYRPRKGSALHVFNRVVLAD